MKYILRILSIFLIFLICIEGTAKSTYSFETCKAFYQLDAREQFEKFVQINESYITSEEYDKTNFVFVYAPGEDFKFDRPMPRALFMDQDWLWESEPGFMPLAEEIYRDRLITYNNRTHPTTEIKYQHYVVVIDMSKYYLSSSFEELSQNIPVEKLFIEHQSESLDDLVVNDLQFYTTSYEGFIEDIWKGVDFSIFEGEADKLVTTALVSKNFSPLALGGNAGENSNPKINIEVEIRQSGNATGTDWEQYTAATPPNHIGAFETIAFYINSYINTYYNDLEPDDLGCNQFKLYLFNQPIRDYYGTKCSEIDATPKLEGLVKRSAEFLDYLTEVEEAANETGVTPDQIIALNLSVNTWMTTIDGLIAAYKTSSQSDYISWLGDSWESLSGEEKEDFVNRAYYNSMIDITFNSFVDLKSEYYTSIGFLSPMSNSSAVNFFKRISGFTTHENLMYGGSRSLFVESLWSGFSDVLDALNTNSYSQSEKEEVFDLMKGNEDVIWHKILKFNSLGVPGWGVSGEQLVEKLRTFAIETQQQSTSGPNGSSKYNIVQNDYNTVIWELYSKKYKYFDYDGLVLDTEYEIETNGIEERKTTIVDLADGKVGFNFSIKICPEYTNITTDLSNGNSNSTQTCNYQLIDLSTEAPVSMFDLVYFVKLKSPMYAEYCFDDSGQAGLCNNTVAVSPAFYNHTIEHYADVEEAIFNTLVVVQSFGALGVASRFLQAATATQFAIANLFLLNEAVGFYTLIDPAGFHDNMVTLVGEDNAVAMEFAVIAVNAVISFYATKDVPTLSLPNKTLKFEEAVELGVLQQLAKDAKLAGIEVDFGVDGEKIIASIVEDAKLHNTAFNSIRNSKLLDRYGVSNPKILEPAFEATRVNILKLKAQGKNIAPVLNGFDDAKLISWNTNVNNVAFREFFESSVSESILLSRMDDWSSLYNAGKTLSLTDIKTLIFFDRLSTQEASAFKAKILEILNDTDIIELSKNFDKTSNWGLAEMNGNRISFTKFWRDNKNILENYHKLSWNSSIPLSTSFPTGSPSRKLLEYFETTTEPIHTKAFAKMKMGASNLDDFDHKIVGVGVYKKTDGTLSDIFHGYNRKNVNGTKLENVIDDFPNGIYWSEVDVLDPLLKPKLNYLDFVRKDLVGYPNVETNGDLFKKLYNIDDSPDFSMTNKLQAAQRPGIHSEIYTLDKIIKKIRVENPNLVINSLDDLGGFDIKILVKHLDNSHMSTCPHCFHILNHPSIKFIIEP